MNSTTPAWLKSLLAVRIPPGGIDDKKMSALSVPRLAHTDSVWNPCRKRAGEAARGTTCAKLETAFERHRFGLVP
jgi:hypothetical protein